MTSGSSPPTFVADITSLLGDESGWPPHHTVIVRKEPLHPRYRKDPSAYEKQHDMRYQTFATNTRRRQAAWWTASTGVTPGPNPRSATRRRRDWACCPRAS